VALDFDHTLVDLHTDREEAFEIPVLAEYIRPFFMEFIPLAINSNILVAIVTFSRHVHMIYSLLKHCFGATTADRMTIRGNDGSWEYVGTAQYAYSHILYIYKPHSRCIKVLGAGRASRVTWRVQRSSFAGATLAYRSTEMYEYTQSPILVSRSYIVMAIAYCFD
jgi:hypothetical protein